MRHRRTFINFESRNPLGTSVSHNPFVAGGIFAFEKGLNEN